jgi:hypothetical protein
MDHVADEKIVVAVDTGQIRPRREGRERTRAARW